MTLAQIAFALFVAGAERRTNKRNVALLYRRDFLLDARRTILT
jgi:hypothetical protein